MILPHQIWKEIMHKRTDFDRLLQQAETSPFWIRDLSIKSDKIQNAKVLKLTLFGNILYVKRKTLDRLFVYEQCIDHMYGWLCENTHLVDTKFKRFVKILQQNNITGVCYESKTIDWDYAAKVIRDNEDFGCDSLVDCELLACALPDIVHYALEHDL
ncbi:uncharacterized protein LOC116853520 [Odontomachus brunneus]|uniref:uncharacterized protein LOC116853520 n=1 Tax=Odontomachus brunneus TaxID=486640 RepID=UPI0013F2A192|nr:uncharacterized protein LOC116853520 [Odontomachus brunneus]